MSKKWSTKDIERLQARGFVATIAFHPGKKNKKWESPTHQQKDCKEVTWMWEKLSWWALDSGITVIREYKFHPERKFRFDFALINEKIAIEYEGINSQKSRHTSLTGYTADTEKYNIAAAAGWRVIRVTVLNYRNFLNTLREVIYNT